GESVAFVFESSFCFHNSLPFGITISYLFEPCEYSDPCRWEMLICNCYLKLMMNFFFFCNFSGR
ncbi:hypothetical protein QQP08_004725, partial [Theobroma cacao]